jgi:hypothetical protein
MEKYATSAFSYIKSNETKRAPVCSRGRGIGGCRAIFMGHTDRHSQYARFCDG